MLLTKSSKGLAQFLQVKNGIFKEVGNWYAVKRSYIIPGGMHSLELKLKMCRENRYICDDVNVKSWETLFCDEECYEQ